MKPHNARIAIAGLLGICLAAATLNSQGAGGQVAGDRKSVV